METEPTTYYVSDSAYQGLIQQAVQLQYVSPGSQRQDGISGYVCALSECELFDARPEDIRELDETLLNDHRLPYWSSEETRRPRFLDINLEANIRFYLHALRLRMLVLDRIILGGKGPIRGSLESTTGYVLEAIGIGWAGVHEWPDPGRFARKHDKARQGENYARY